MESNGNGYDSFDEDIFIQDDPQQQMEHNGVDNDDDCRGTAAEVKGQPVKGFAKQGLGREEKKIMLSKFLSDNNITVQEALVALQNHCACRGQARRTRPTDVPGFILSPFDVDDRTFPKNAITYHHSARKWRIVSVVNVNASYHPAYKTINLESPEQPERAYLTVARKGSSSGELKKPVLCHEKHNEDAKALRILGRLQYHVRSRKDMMNSSWKPMAELLPEIHSLFVNKGERQGVDNEIEEGNERPAGDATLELNANFNEACFCRKVFVVALCMENIFNSLAEVVDEQCEHQRGSGLENGDVEEYVAVTRLIDEAAPISKVVEEEVRQAHDEITPDVAGPIGMPALSRTTMIRLCDNSCPVPGPGESSFIYSLLIRFVDDVGLNSNAPTNSSLEVIFEKKHKELCELTAYEWINVHQRCYAGLRTIRKRLAMQERFYKILVALNEAIETVDIPVLKDIILLKKVPKCLVVEATKELPANEQAHHTEGETIRAYETLFEDFEKAMRDLEREFCEVCDQMRRSSTLIFKETEGLERWLTEELMDKEVIKVCVTCRRQFQQKSIPKCATYNELETVIVPECLVNLNWIEKSLIQLVRPVQQLVRLRDTGNRITRIPGTKGVLVLLPVPVEATIDHLVATLPSTENMKILVDGEFDRRIVNLEAVLLALRWLKENHDDYRDIEINEHFVFNSDSVTFTAPTVQERYEQLLAEQDAEDPGHLLTQQDVQFETIQDVRPPNVDGTSLEQYLLQKNKYLPMKIDELAGQEAKAFPHLLVNGRFGFNAKRKKKLSLSNYVRSRLLQRDRRFARDPAWIAYQHGVRVQLDIAGSLGIQARLKKNVSAAEVRQLLDNQDPKFATLLTSTFGKVKGFAPYWDTVRNDLRATIAVFGPPQFFLTLNPNECWPEVEKVYSYLCGVNTLEGLRAELAADPVPWTRVFQQRVRALFDLLKNPKGPLGGGVIHWFTRLEYQHRGAEHLHCVLWTKERLAENATEDELISFIDKNVTARMPDALKEPQLYKLVMDHQQHWQKHSATCLRVVKHRSQLYKVCRFEFPRPVLTATVINAVPTTLMGVPGGKRKPYYLARNENAKMTNDYAPAVLMTWGANVDVQVVFSVPEVVQYITGYTTKAETSKEDVSLYKSLHSQSIPQRDLMGIILELVKKRQIGTPEMIDSLLGHPFHKFDTGHVFINTNACEQRDRLLQSKKNLEKNDRIFVANFNDDYYPARPARLENHSLMNVALNFDCVDVKRVKRETFAEDDGDADGDGDDDNTEEVINTYSGLFTTNDPESPFYDHSYLKNGQALPLTSVTNRCFRKRKALVPRLFWPHLEANNEASREDYYRRLCVAFIPWRREEDLKANEATYEERWKTWLADLSVRSTAASEDVKKFIGRQEHLLEMDRKLFEERRERRQALAEIAVDLEPVDQVDYSPRIVDEEKLSDAKTKLNEKQASVVKRVLDHVATNNDTLTLFVSGTAGTGKSFVINVLADELTVRYTDPSSRGYQPAVLLVAPTGLAAIQIRGATFHSCFGIEVQSGTQNGLKVHLRLQEIRGSSKMFGGINVVGFGDLLQLAPVRSSRVFEVMQERCVRRLLGSMAPFFSLWCAFEYEELLENMRQRDDLEYAELMGRLRVGCLTPLDEELLATRVIPKHDEDDVNETRMKSAAIFYSHLIKTDPKALALFPTNEDVKEFNRFVAKELELATFVIEAEDHIDTSKSRRFVSRRRRNEYMERPYQRTEFTIEKKTEQSTKRTTNGEKNEEGSLRAKSKKAAFERGAGLDLHLELALGCRVMLRRNVSVATGLVNGATGVLLDVKKAGDGTPYALTVKMDRCEETVDIFKQSAVFDIGSEEQLTRRQFPLVMSFAATIHKSQGLTLSNTVLGMRSTFAAGQVFVGCSRVQNLNGLHLVELDPRKMMVDKMSLNEYNRLRETIGLPSFVSSPKKPTSETAVVQINRPKRRSSDQNSCGSVKIVVRTPKSNQKKGSSKKCATPTSSSNDSGTPESPSLLKLKNVDNTQCFLIAAINAVNTMTKVAEELIGTVDEELNEVAKELKDILRGDQNDVRALRNKLGGDLAQAGQQDAQDALSALLEALPTTIRQLFTMNQRDVRWCGCEDGRQILDVHPIILRPFVTRDISFEDMLRILTETEHFGECNECGMQVCMSHAFDLSNVAFLIVQPDRAVGQAQPNINGLSSKKQFMFGFEWRLVGCIEYRGRAVDGHYVTWRQCETIWAVQDDDRTTPVKQINRGLQ
ncbi:unnamed protein product, partial [Caenorhabditis auriculariae]